VGQQYRVAIRLRARDLCMTDRAARTSDIFNDNLLAESSTQWLG
jgi:hypothetical protein